MCHTWLETTIGPFLAHATFRPSLRMAPSDSQPILKKVLGNCQGTKIFHAEVICDTCRRSMANTYVKAILQVSGGGGEACGARIGLWRCICTPNQSDEGPGSKLCSLTLEFQ